MHPRHIAALFLLLSIPPATGRAQTAPETHAISLGLYDDTSQLLLIKPDEVRIRGVKGRVRAITPEDSSRRILILLDISGSMGGGSGSLSSMRWEVAQRLIEEFVLLLQPGDMVAFHTFAVTHEELCGFARDTRCILERLRALPAPGSKDAKKQYGPYTHLADALNETLALANEDMRWGDAVVLVSDGGPDSGSVANWNRVRANYVRRGIRAFHFQVSHGFSAYKEDRQEILMLQSHWGLPPAFIRETGGLTLDPWELVPMPYAPVRMSLDPAMIKKSCLFMYRLIREFYRVEIELATPLQEEKKIKIEVWDSQKKKKRLGALLYPHRIFPVPPPRSP